MVLTGRWRKQRNWGCRITEGNLYGLRTVTLENKRIRVTFLVDKGADLIEWLYKPDDMDFAWLTPDGVRDPRSYVSTSPDLSATFHDYYPGGWQELFPNAGVPSQRYGAQFGQHGEVANLPWDVTVLEDTEDAVAVTFRVRTQKTPFLVERTVRLEGDSAFFLIEGTVRNECDFPMEAMWGQHVTFGTPFLHPGARIVMPEGVRVFLAPRNEDAKMWLKPGDGGPWPLLPANPGTPQNDEGLADLSVLPPRGTPNEMTYITDFGDDGWYAVESDEHRLGVRLSWDARRFPFVWHWHSYGADPTYPWYGRNYNIGLEPQTSWSRNALPGAVENGTALKLEPRGSASSWIRTEIYRLGER